MQDFPPIDSSEDHSVDQPPHTGNSYAAIGGGRKHLWLYQMILASVIVILTVFSLNHKLERRKTSNSYGRFYSNYAQTLEDIDTRITYRWLSPSMAYFLGFRKDTSWVNFLMGAYVLGSVALCYFSYRNTGQFLSAGVISLIPISTMAAWYSMILPGYPDWLIVGLPFAVLLFRNKTLLFVCCIVCIWSHERSLFLWLLIPFARALWFEADFDFRDFFKQLSVNFCVFTLDPRRLWLVLQNENKSIKNILWDFVIIGFVFVSYFAFRDLLSPGDARFTFEFYLNETVNGSIFATKQPLTLEVFEKCYWEAVKFLWIPFFVSIFVIMRNRGRKGIWEGLFYLFWAGFVGLQLFVAADSVRLLDLLNMPLILPMLKAVCLTRSTHWKWGLLALIIAAILINQYLPVRYIGLNGEFDAWGTDLKFHWNGGHHN